MRVMITDEDGSCHIIKVNEMFFDTDINKLVIVDYDNFYSIFSGISIEQSNSLMKQMLKDDYLDLTAFSVEVLDEDEYLDLVENENKIIDTKSFTIFDKS